MKASLILKSNKIFDSISDEPFAGFVAIAGNKILKVSKDETEMEALVDENTVIKEYQDKLVMPAFNDAHTHLLLAGVYKTYLNLGDGLSEEICAKMCKDFADSKPEPDDKWFIAFNWYHYRWPEKNLPKKETLDKYFPNRPVILLAADAHSAWVNSKALELAGITNETENPFGGEIYRNENGEATGFLYESALAFVCSIAFDFTKEEEELFIKNFIKAALPLGITSVTDVQPYFGRDLGSLEVFKKMEDEGTLKLRIHAAPNLFGDLQATKEDAKKYNSEKIRVSHLKQFVDGVIPSHTALMVDDYYDAPGNKGTQLNKLDNFESAIDEAHKLGFSVKIHAIGDYACKFTLDCYEKAINKYGDTGARHAIEHCEMVADDDFERFGRLGVIPSVQPEHIGLIANWDEEEYRYVLGEDMAAKTWSFKRLLDEVGVLALGSDCPVVDNNPFYEIHRGATRLHDDGLPVGGWNPSQKLTVAELLKSFTYGSAYSSCRENEMGQLKEGQLADVIVIDRDLFAVDPSELRDGQVILTVMDGNVEYEI